MAARVHGHELKLTRAERIAEVFSRLRDASPVASPCEARALLDATLIAVEDEYSGLPDLPDRSNTPARVASPDDAAGGRMYPPGDPSPARDRPGWLVIDAQRERIYLGADGTIEVVRAGVTVFLKSGVGDYGQMSPQPSAAVTQA